MATAECANPLFLAWVKEWWDQARERNTKGALAYRHAYESLRACPVRFEHPDQLLALRGFGPKTCGRLLDRLTQHCEANGLPVPPKRRLPPGARSRIEATAAPSPADVRATIAGSPDRLDRPARPARRQKAYVPVPRTGGYALIMALSAPESEGGRRGGEWMAKAELIALAQPHCDTSFTVRPPGKFYTAWDSIKTLLSKDLVVEQKRPAKRYALTEDGWEIARRLRHVVSGSADAEAGPRGGEAATRTDQGGIEQRPPEDLIPDGPAVASDAALPDIQPIVLPAGSYSVQLVLDVRERVAGQRSYMEDELAKKHGIRPLVRALSLGDALWVAKCQDPAKLRTLSNSGEEEDCSDEFVLDWVVERKRQDDLVGSIRDGRFREQKFRLRRSGVRHVVYLVEDGGLDPDVLHRYEAALQSAVAATQVVNGYFVKKTQSVDDSIAYLAKLTKLLAKKYADRPLHVIPTTALTAQNYLPLLRKLREGGGSSPATASRVPSTPTPTPEYCVSYAAFASLTSKSEVLTLRDVFLKMLLCTRGVTGERALEIQRRWPTPYAFVQAYERLGRESGEDPALARKRKREMVSDALGGLAGSKRKVSKALSEKLAEVWADAAAEAA